MDNEKCEHDVGDEILYNVKRTVHATRSRTGATFVPE
jgi:hypothetical protein